ncbi:RcnB family protein [Rhizobiaceae bacterium n13]|uniref:RcnB family protein n=1 Tax=Ferirhizobium litorale TaxID=2927786 RepID=A0AAE3QEE6_9HYPH|nr:RcnB family protein [Fererhizobium litorale]MDI7863534.1 RcnB family protein [Fererhizobium litorale]MDI7923545.1 RcnB family protein [Fererhizobium litorale]
MKKIFAALLSASFLLSPMVASQANAGPRHDHSHTVIEKKKVVVTRHHRWSKGHHLSPGERRRMAEVRDYRRHHLHAPPRGYRWVRADNDYLLVGITSGIVASIIAGR